MNHRGVSPVVGMVLLVGLTSIVAVGILAVGVTITDATSSAAETQQVQSSMEQLADVGERVSAGETNTESFTLSGSDSGTASVDPDAGRLVITHNTSSEKELYSDSLGAYTYETDGTTFAYQGGGVWRAEEHGDPQMVAPPAFEYRSGPPGSQEATLNFPIMRVTGNAVGGEVVDGTLNARDRRAIYPSNESHENPLKDGEVYIDIASEYCEGWEAHIGDRTDGNVVESCDEVGNATDIGQLRAELSVPPESSVSAAAVATHRVSPHGGASSSIDGDVVVDGGESSIDNETTVNGTVYDEDPPLPSTNVSAKKSLCSGHYTSIRPTPPAPRTINGSAPQVVDSGTPVYCFDELDANDKLTVAPEQDLEIVFKDRIKAPGGNSWLTVTDDNGSHSVDIYTDKKVAYKSAEKPMGNPSNPAQTTLYADDRVLIQGDGSEFYGRIVAPALYPSVGAVELTGNANVTGSVYSTTIFLQSSESSIRWDESMTGFDVGPDGRENPLYYLHLSETTLEVRD